MNNEEKILALLEKMDQRLDKLEQGQAKLEQGQAELKEEITTARQRVVVVESKVIHELKILNEGLSGWSERNRQIDRLEDKYDSHDHRIFALEQVVGK